ncbi:hypothetical protein ROHU_024940 [Labeo rohita]|uniref:Uncharacterized protein n=1 Tax=Labeo rohita TaxID=84645 RepID=A0A498MJK2_LABRO|nr:hypothetical protein ROHU_024940 [Labeo rohita]
MGRPCRPLMLECVVWGTQSGGLSRRPMRDQGIGWVSLACGQQVWRPARKGSHRAGKKEGTPAWEGSRSNCWEIKTPGVAPGGEETWSLACWEEREEGEPAWEGSRGN